MAGFQSEAPHECDLRHRRLGVMIPGVYQGREAHGGSSQHMSRRRQGGVREEKRERQRQRRERKRVRLSNVWHQQTVSRVIS